MRRHPSHLCQARRALFYLRLCLHLGSPEGRIDPWRGARLRRRHHPPQEGEQPVDLAAARNGRARYVRVDPIKLPATSLPNSLQVSSRGAGMAVGVDRCRGIRGVGLSAVCNLCRSGAAP